MVPSTLLVILMLAVLYWFPIRRWMSLGVKERAEALQTGRTDSHGDRHAA